MSEDDPHAPDVDDHGRLVIRRHDTVIAVAHDPHTFSNAVSQHVHVPNGLDGEEHAAARRLLDPFLALLDDAQDPAGLTRDIAFHARNPHLARILQYATLGGGEPLELIQRRWYRPFFERALLLAPEKNAIVQKNPALLPWVICAFHSLILGYATMAPLHRELLGIDPFSAEGVARPTRSSYFLSLKYGSTGPCTLMVNGLPWRSLALPAVTRTQPSLMQYSSTLVFSMPLKRMPTSRERMSAL